MTTRRYVSPVRTAAADRKRDQVVAAAGRLLRDGPLSEFSMDAVAKAAGVTRLTVYRQFGSRRALFEAVFDERAQKGGLHQIPQALAMPDPWQALDRLIEIFCGFWSSDEAVGRLHDAMAADPEFAQALADRNERRRKLMGVLVGRIAPTAGSQARSDAVDLLFAMTSYAMFAMLRPGRRPEEIGDLVKSACAAVIAGLIEPHPAG